ncbi:hypothetical protein VTJ04DRAFT_9022 [Mycothermus thermophilus]|uniref:uncharacterized protein n=1 Tax=Humicola insolens TaxID=85995 RepID=UPI0037431E2A
MQAELNTSRYSADGYRLVSTTPSPCPSSPSLGKQELRRLRTAATLCLCSITMMMKKMANLPPHLGTSHERIQRHRLDGRRYTAHSVAKTKQLEHLPT